jgi:pyrimidine-nucleoside phosphorylase
MKTIEDARKLAKIMVNIGKKLNRDTIAVLTDMEQPLGQAVRNNLEVIEAIETLKGKGPKDLEELCLVLGANMLKIAGKVEDYNKGYELLEELLQNGKAFEQFKKLVKKQGGDVTYLDNPDKFKKSEYIYEIKAKKDGYLNQLKAIDIGLAAMLVGAGREKKGDKILNEVGVKVYSKYGEKVKKGQKIATLHYNKKDKNFEEAVEKLNQSFVIKNEAPKHRELIYEIVD